MRIIDVDLRATSDGKRLKATAAVTLDNGLRLENIKVISVKSEYHVILPAKEAGLRNIGVRGLYGFYRTIRERVLTEFILVMAKTGPLPVKANPYCKRR